VRLLFAFLIWKDARTGGADDVQLGTFSLKALSRETIVVDAKFALSNATELASIGIPMAAVFHTAALMPCLCQPASASKIFRHSGTTVAFKTTFKVFTRASPNNSLERLTERSVGLVSDRPSNVYELLVTLLQ
jgi:hypothetical protein